MYYYCSGNDKRGKFQAFHLASVACYGFDKQRLWQYFRFFSGNLLAPVV